MNNGINGRLAQVAVTLAITGILGAVGVYAQVRENTGDIEDAKEVHREINEELKEISRNQADIRESVAGVESKVDSIYDVIVKDQAK